MAQNLFDNTTLYQIENQVKELSPLLAYMEIEADTGNNVTTYWAHHIDNTESFKAELRTNRDFIGADRDRYNVYVNTLNNSVLIPTNTLIAYVDQWLKHNPDKSFSLAVFLPDSFQHKPTWEPDQKRELRKTLIQMKAYLMAIQFAIFEVLNPIRDALQKNITFASAVDNRQEQDKPALLKLTHVQIAILHHLNGTPITKNNAKEIAYKYGQTSGKKLENTYNDLMSELTRTARAKTRVEDYEKLIPLLEGDSKIKGTRELEITRENNKKK